MERERATKERTPRVKGTHSTGKELHASDHVSSVENVGMANVRAHSPDTTALKTTAKRNDRSANFFQYHLSASATTSSPARKIQSLFERKRKANPRLALLAGGTTSSRYHAQSDHPSAHTTDLTGWAVVVGANDG